MMADPGQERSSDIFVGRERELAELRAGLAEASTRRGRFFMVAGEPGIGKTTLADELANSARQAGAQVLIGRCWEGGGAPAYWPWVQIIRSHLQHDASEASLQQMGGTLADIAQLVPEVVADSLAPTFAPHDSILPEPQAGTPEQARFRQFDATTRMLKNAAVAQPLVLIFDDLHAGDQPSLLLLRFFARELRGMRVLVIGTYREEEIRHPAPAAELMGELARDSHRIFLRGLSEPEVALFIQKSIGRAPSESLVATVYQATGGNPFFVDEVVRLLIAEGRVDSAARELLGTARIPGQVREAVRRHLRPLAPEAARLLAVAAVVGREFDVTVMERSDARLRADAGEESPISRHDTLDAIGAALRAGILVEVSAAMGRYRFSHALIRETLYDDLPPARRSALHAAIGATLEQLSRTHSASHVAEIAHHFFHAAAQGDAERGIHYALLAASHATAQLAYEEALNQYMRALQLLDLGEPGNALRRCEILLGLAEAQRNAGTTQAAEQTGLQAMGIADELRKSGGDPDPIDRLRERAVACIDPSGLAPVQENPAPVTSQVDASEVRDSAMDRRNVPDALEVSPRTGQNLFRREGEYWTIAYGNRTWRLRDMKGLTCIAELLRHPGQDLPAAHLITLGESHDSELDVRLSADTQSMTSLGLGDAGEMLDGQAKQAYKRRLSELQRERDEAQRFNDTGRVARAQHEMELVTQELVRAVGLGGRERRASSLAERARVNVTRTITAAIKKIADYDAALGSHFMKAIKTGTFCSYTPDPRCGEWVA